jgi:hypothetical protein
VHILLEAEKPAVEVDRGVHVVDDIPNTHSGHRRSSVDRLLCGTYDWRGPRSSVSDHRAATAAWFLTGLQPEAARRGAAAAAARAQLAELALTTESKALAKDLKRRGWRFVGPTTVSAFMQAMGLVNDHLDGCDARASVDSARKRFERP